MYLPVQKIFLLVLLFFCLPAPNFAQQVVSPKVGDQLQPATAAHIGGFVGNKLDLAYTNRILAQDVDRLIQPFMNRTEERCWQTEFWGKWFTSAVQAYTYRPEPQLKALIDAAAAKLINTQTPDGYIGNYTEAKRLEQWDIWGRKYCLLGLLSYYDLTGDRNSLRAARRLADHLMNELNNKKAAIVQKGNHRGMAASSVLEPITLLYARTGEKRYLDFAEEIVRQWESPSGPQLISKSTVNVSERFSKPKSWWGHEQGQKAYEMMSCYEGLLELYRLTGKEHYKQAVVNVWENIRQTEINVAGSGSSMECWFGGKRLQPFATKHYQETCVTATWIKLSQQLLRLTGEARYADAVEQSFYNALLGSMKPDGSTWAKYSPLEGIRTEGEDQCKMGLNCCVASGPRGLFTLPLTTIMQHKKGVAVNFFLPGSYKAATPKGQRIELVQETDYPVNGTISISMDIAKPETFRLDIRVPEWSKRTGLRVNGERVETTSQGAYVPLTREWKKGDRITLDLDMRGRLEQIEGQPSYTAIMRGPLVFARDKRLEEGMDIDESITPELTPDGFVQAEAVPSDTDDFWMLLKIPCMAGSYRAEASGKPVDLLFCDYASAGNTYAAESRFRVWFPQLLDPSASTAMP